MHAGSPLPTSGLIDPVPLLVPRPLVLLRLGYRRPDQVPERSARLIAEILDQGAARLRPRAVLGEFDVAIRPPDGAEIGGRLRASSRSLFERLDGCRRAVLFAATIGPDVEEWGHALSQAGDLTRALIVDAYASAAAIALGTEIEKRASALLGANGLGATRRYAPGYGDWSLADQAPLCAMVGAERIGVVLTEDHLMIPAKSISGVIGGK